MGIIDTFEIASGSTMGRDHRMRLAKNNQDGFCVIRSADVIVAVVTDGCSSGNFSGFGAVLGAQVVANAVSRSVSRAIGLRQGENSLAYPTLWERVRQDVLAQLRTLALTLRPDGSLTDFVVDYLLFTVIGVTITPQISAFFGIGDGLIMINDEKIVLEPNEGNEPAYLGYSLLDPSQIKHVQEQLRFQLLRVIPTEKVQHFFVATDGAESLLEAEERLIPGRTVKVGPISQLWMTDRFFTNPFALPQFLLLVNTDSQRIDWDRQAVTKNAGLLFDDTTIVVGRRKLSVVS